MRLLLLLSLTAATAEPAAGARAGSSHEPPQILAMKPIVVPIVASDRLDGALRITVALTAPDEPALARLTQKLPVLRATAVGQAIEFSRLHASPRMPVDAALLRQGLTTVLHDGDIASVLITEVSATA
ncbi:hypothetical protein FSB78_00790 [Sphingomonas ginsenosidivorax]|uniref:Uncharacterized protein n=1 Tax=Sphingomonas ginsenosidivorax TaxID=862135 RepID=A0A5C6UAT6_9SPHN|nr:hypothetical protein [Sphingomonas ginsenosidivorax]TXC69660.1 hypothetical protein FSB78_00790 [Sphingomonas ginsenosidivorax]